MAIGDCFNIFMGTAATVRQPSSGVFEKILAVGKHAVVDTVNYYDGSNANAMFSTATRTGRPTSQSAAYVDGYDTAIFIGNTTYIQKTGTTDTIWVSGVQVDA
jgi:hypothetical protein